MENDVKKLLAILNVNPEKVTLEQVKQIEQLLDYIYQDGRRHPLNKK